MPMIKKIISDSLEILKDAAKESVEKGAKQLVETVSPVKLLEQATGVKTGSNTLGDYLKNQAPDLTAEQIAQKNQADQKALEAARNIISSTTPAHMRLPQQPKELRPYEETLRDQEEKKQANIKAAQVKPLMTPVGIKKGWPKKRKIQGAEAFGPERYGPEARDIKIG